MPWTHVGGTHQARICEKAVFLFQESGQRTDVRIVSQLGVMPSWVTES